MPRTKDSEPDFVDEMVEQFTEKNPEFPRLLDAAQRRRAVLSSLTELRQERQLSQTTVAAAMHTSQSALARLEGAADTKLSTLDRYAAALGCRVEYRLVPERKRKPKRR
jgi:DNA-binding Xre family transcriptional regulator